MSNPILWRPPPECIQEAAVTAFMQRLGQRSLADVNSFHELYEWSVQQPEQFWQEIWAFTEVIASARADKVLVEGDHMAEASWFPGARLNYAENLLRQRGGGDALVFRGEDRVRRRLSHDELLGRAGRLAHRLRALGVTRGDRVAGLLPNIPETVIAALATASIGAVWSSCSPDFGVRGVLDRFGQIAPRVLIGADGYFYKGEWIDSLPLLAALARELPSLKRVLVASYSGEGIRLPADLQQAESLEHALEDNQGEPPVFEQLPFDHPLFILFSSGTTGAPKAIVHSAGGTLLQHLKEHQLHSDIRAGDRVFYFTTCGWMMWNWQLSALASGATLLLYDGSPMIPDSGALFDYAEAEEMTHFGTSARYLDALRKQAARPAETHDLARLRTLFSTGSPLHPAGFDYVYDSIKQDLCLASISGGTEIISCFLLGCPTLPVHRGELQVRGLGMQIEVYNEAGQAVMDEKGELVCSAPFPSMPLGFWNDPHSERYRAAYFERFPGVWCHGDYVMLASSGGAVIYGRSDTVLNPGGVRIGTAEIYRQVETLDEVLESIAIGQEWDGDSRIVLFVVLKPGLELSAELEQGIRDRIRKGASPRHEPARIVRVEDIPRTRSGKISELAVREVVHDRPLKNAGALANPEVLEQFRQRPELQT